MKRNRFIPISLPDLSGNERKYLNECIDTGWISSIGEFVNRFEQNFAAFCQQPFAVSLNSGTAALHLALRVLGVKPNDEVIVPALTFASTANAVLYQHATPVFIDSGVDHWNMDAHQLDDLITNKTRAIIPVHLYGLPCEMSHILSIADFRQVPIVEDCAEAHGATFSGKPVGSFGRIGCFSFYGNKMVTTGEGGICVTQDRMLYEKMCFLRDHGMRKDRRYWHEEVGFNYRMTNLQAAVGCAQLERIEAFIQKRRWIKEQYNARLDGLGCVLPDDRAQARSVFWLYSLLLPEGTKIEKRDQLIEYLRRYHIDSRPFFYPIPDMPPYKQFARPVPNAASISARGITLPSHYSLNEDDIDFVCGVIRKWFGGGQRPTRSAEYRTRNDECGRMNRKCQNREKK
jgi:perosamine synthetase